jgi:hypothetical protein
VLSIRTIAIAGCLAASVGVAGGGCGERKGASFDAGSAGTQGGGGLTAATGGASGAAGSAGAGGSTFIPATTERLCEGLPPLDLAAADPTGPFVTYQDDTGESCVLTIGSMPGDPAVCDKAVPSGIVEPGCPALSIFFYFSTPNYGELGVQGAYAFTRRRVARHGKVREIAIDATEPAYTRGHFVIDLEATETSPATRATGRFGMCMTPGLSLEPCRDM